jgi:CheY-like chemotaxis protein
MHILLAGRDPEQIALVREALLDARLVSAFHGVTDGQEALDYVFCIGKYSERDPESGPQLVLLDVDLPKPSGQEVVRQLKKDERSRRIPVVGLCDEREAGCIAGFYDAGGNSMLLKPAESRAFQEFIQAVGRYWKRYNETPEVPGCALRPLNGKDRQDGS